MFLDEKFTISEFINIYRKHGINTMEERLCKYCLTDNVVRILDQHVLYVFGAGTFGEDFFTLYKDQLHLAAYIDNAKNGYRVNGIPIISLQEYMDCKTSPDRIVITTEYYSLEIAQQLMGKGLEPGIDFYIWDPKGIYHLDENTKRYIAFNQKIWSGYEQKDSTKKILIPFMRSQDTGAVMYSYIGNYWAKKYEAQLVAYVRGGRPKNTVSEPIRKVYESFHVTDVLTPELDPEQCVEARKLLDEAWPNIKSISDWHQINLYGIPIGTVIVQNYLRYEMFSMEYDELKWRKYLWKAFSTVVFWYHWFKENDVKLVVLLDWGIYDGYMRDIACHFGIPAYCVYYTVQTKMCIGYSQNRRRLEYSYYKKFWNTLSAEEQEYGIQWAKKDLANRLAGNLTDVDFGEIQSPFVKASNTHVTSDNEKTKILVCPHIFEEDSIHSGWQIFGNYITWLLHLGDLSQKTDYDWYIKEHPAGSNRDRIFIEDYCRKFPNIKRLPIDVSPSQLAAEGVKFALTVCGTLGHEYPLLGVQVINAGNNPHIAYDFNYNPKTIAEYDELILNLDKLHKKIDLNEIYQFYCIHYHYYKHEGIECWKNFFTNPRLVGNEIDSGSWKYQAFMDEWSEQRHTEILDNVEHLFDEMDARKADVFYR